MSRMALAIGVERPIDVGNESIPIVTPGLATGSEPPEADLSNRAAMSPHKSCRAGQPICDRHSGKRFVRRETHS